MYDVDGPFETACSTPIRPHAFPIVCLNHTTSSSDPLLVYSSFEESSCTLNFSYVSLTGKTRTNAVAGRGTNARRSGSSMLKTSWKPSFLERPSL